MKVRASFALTVDVDSNNDVEEIIPDGFVNPDGSITITEEQLREVVVEHLIYLIQELGEGDLAAMITTETLPERKRKTE